MVDFIVTTLTDENDASATVAAPGGTGLSLREAITLANGTAATDSITFDPSLSGGTITLNGGQLELRSSISIDGDVDGDNVADITIDGNDASRVFSVASRNVALDSLTIQNGNAGADGSGGGVYIGSGQSATISNSTISGNSAGSNGGGIFARGTANVINSTISGNNSEYGAGLYNSGGTVVTLTNSTISGNSATSDGGGLANGPYGNATLTNVTISGNSANFGGGLFNNGMTITLNNTLVLGNSGRSEIFQNFGNIVANNSILRGDAANVFAQIDPVTGGGLLANFGGPVATIALLANIDNPALDAGNDSLAPANDARGFSRVDVNGANVANNGTNISDLGAFEIQNNVFENSSLIVTITGDVVDPFDGETSLREALALANETPGVDEITFASGAGEAFENGGTIRLDGGDGLGGDPGGELVATEAVTITGLTDMDDNPLITITGDRGNDDVTLGDTDITDVAASFGDMAGAASDLLDDNSRVLNVMSLTGTTTLTGLIITGGRTTAANEDGGGIRTAGNLELTNATVSGNSTSGVSADGGGILSGDTTLTNSTVSGNSTIGIGAEGGGIFSRDNTTLTNSTVSGNSTSGNYAPGGGIFSENDTNLTNSTVSGNSTSGDGADGGGIYSSDTTLTNSTVSGNSTSGDSADGGGIYSGFYTILTNSTVSGNSTSGDGADSGGIFSSNTTLTNSTVSGNSTSGNYAPGGGISSVENTTLTNSTVSGNSTSGSNANGGGIASSNTTLSNSTVSGNSTRGGGADGGGIDSSNTTLTNSTVSGNSTSGFYADGGGINSNNTTLTNSTVSGNSTSGVSADGGGILSSNTTLTNTTVSGNSTSGFNANGGGIFSFGNFTLTNSIVLGNNSARTAFNEIFNVSGSTTGTGLNIVGTGTDTDDSDGIINANPEDVFAATVDNNGVSAGVLADNGGPVETILILAGGLAQNAGDASFLPADSLDLDGNMDVMEALPVDARGEERVSGSGLDLGAVELQNTAPVANDDAVSTSENIPVGSSDAATGLIAGFVGGNFNLQADTDVDGDELTIIEVDGDSANVGNAFTTSEGGTVIINVDGSFNYDPGTAFIGLAAGDTATDVISYTISDGNGETSTANLTVTINGVNDDPVITEGQSFTTDENTSVSGVVLATDINPGTMFTFTQIDGQMIMPGMSIALDSGALVTADATGAFEYDPNDRFESLGVGEMGSDSFAITVIDNEGGMDTETVTINLTGVNDAPEFQDGVSIALDETTDNAAITGMITLPFTDVDMADTDQTAVITEVAASGATDGLADDGTLISYLSTLSGFNDGMSGGGTFTTNFTAPSSAFDYLAIGETVTLTYTAQITDQDATTSNTFDVVITGTNDAPVAMDDMRSVGESDFINNGQLLANDMDVDGDTLTITEFNGMARPTSVFDVVTAGGRTASFFIADGLGNNDFLFNTNGNFQDLAFGESDSFSFEYTVEDGNGGRDTATATVIIEGRGTSIPDDFRDTLTEMNSRVPRTGPGTNSDEVIAGGTRADVIFGRDGDDRIVANGGNDTVLGDAGEDTLVGGGGRDVLLGGADNDRVDGGGGADILLGGSGNDLILGRGGADDIDDGAGNDQIFAGNGNDTVFLRMGNDVINLGGGADLVVAEGPGFGLDTISDFRQRQGDQLDLRLLGVDSAADALAIGSQVGNFAELVFGNGDVIRLRGIDINDLTNDDFVRDLSEMSLGAGGASFLTINMDLALF